MDSRVLHFSLIVIAFPVIVCSEETGPAGGDPGRPPKFSRPEERGEDLSGLPTPELVKRLAHSTDKIELRKAAKALGDRTLGGGLQLSDDEKAVIEKVVMGYLALSKSTDANEHSEAMQQIERLWLVAEPALLKNLDGGGDLTKAELAVKSLILMRNEAIIKAIIEKARTAKDEQSKGIAIFALKMMKEQRRSLIPGRKCLDEKESQALYEKLVLPALKELNQTPEL